MSGEEEQTESVTVNIGEWVEKARADPQAYHERQATEVFLTALGMIQSYRHQVFLKGGILMGVVYGSPRQTGDLDFTACLDPEPGIADDFKKELDAVFPRATAELGYPELICAVQSCRYLPNAKLFPKAEGPALMLKVAYADRGTRQADMLEQGRAANVLDVDISFREPVGAIQIVNLADTGGSFYAYSLIDLMAEKLRALLQQEMRNRYRRQDIYDLDALLMRFSLDKDEKSRLCEVLLKKCRARHIEPHPESLSQPEIIRRAKEEWKTLELEIGEVPDFDECFARVDAFYRELPWSAKNDESK
ncbi:hypothetical protein FIV06_04355 [Labrenzia sp. THAF191b]|uniref:nucleotidyl transferase AbiEii/AbiGii toxin family protein n=1 Tax=unclassified Labrenzia TaxID=2648686 RepID=UPI001267A526|nr:MULTISPECIES: nucleotidyl transferase AbiEii/AbiGii toxin family protein [unclassified Labrenzia]QFS96639.1 hypothetical protein FIV06_04355 [Labrenzia sp. THAF191b]QFT02954.1 hypothetical protein FIV05_04355 [Labrenzia sp. THAF191a]QFT14496.1 hypothetical protein FIV03_04360 [Labrenzia sp. THAF187b]